MFSRIRCGLCDRAREAILALRGEVEFEYDEVFVDGYDALEREYGLRVPVVLVNGDERFETEVEPATLRAVLLAGGA